MRAAVGGFFLMVVSACGSVGGEKLSKQAEDVEAEGSGPMDSGPSDGADGGAAGSGEGGDGGGESPFLGEPQVILPEHGLGPDALGIVANGDEPLSVEIAQMYADLRGIPRERILVVNLGVDSVLSAEAFPAVESALTVQFGDGTGEGDAQALLLTFMRPWAVGCMGTSAAFGLGFDTRWCQPGPPCNPTAASDYFRSDSMRPMSDHGVRPTMMLWGSDIDLARTLAERGVASEASFPSGMGFLVRSSDTARNVRWPDMIDVPGEYHVESGLEWSYLDASVGDSELVMGQENILFYFTGLERVNGIEENEYLPGALADHLTSFGGIVPESPQMSAYEWLEAGVTASYGTAIEPCNYPQKFPAVSILVEDYFRGASAVEAYWRSVHWPGEGNWVGDPLARPFGSRWSWSEVESTEGEGTQGRLVVETTALDASGEAWLEGAPSADGPWEVSSEVVFAGGTLGRWELVAQPTTWPWYRLVIR
jgi:uncharacterized protein (TIGR03790 family)